MAVVTLLFQGVDQTQGVMDGLAVSLTSITDLVGGALLKAFEASSDAIQSWVKDAMAGEKQQAALAASISAAGAEMGNTVDSVNALANEFKDLAGGSDEAIVAIEQIGIKAGTIAAEQMPKFIQQTLDLGTVMGSTEAAALLLARAVEDPIAAMNKANKAGIVFSATLKDQIKALVKQGDMAGAAALVTERLGKATEGAAAAAADTLSGKLEIMQNHLDDAGKAIGEALIPMLTNLFDTVIAPAIPLIESFATKMAEGIGKFIYFIQSGVDPIEALKATIYNVFGPEAGAQMEAFLVPVRNVVEYVQSQFPLFQAAILSAWANIQTAAANFGPAIQTNVLEVLAQLKTFWDNNGPIIVATVTALFNTIVNIAGPAMALLSGIIAGALQLINGDWEKSHITMTNSLETFMASIIALTGTDLETVRASWQWVFEAIILIVKTAIDSILVGIMEWFITFLATWQSNWNMAQTIVSTVFKNIKGTIDGWVTQIRDAVQPVFDLIARAQAAVGIANSLGSGASGGMGVPETRASGGSAFAGNPYLVGERGPELFVPSQSGSIVSNYNLTINTQNAPNIPNEFGLARSLAGAL